MARKGRFIDTQPTPANFIQLWQRLHDLDAAVTASNLTIRQHASTIATVQSGLTVAQRNALQALITAGTLVPTPADGGSGTGPVGNPGGGGGGGGAVGPGTCSSAPLSAGLPAWFSAALIAAGQSATSNCYSAVFLAAVEATCNANDFTIQRDSGCAVRPRLYHQGNHGMWGTFCGQPDASAVADYIVNLTITYGDGSIGWGWV